MIHAFTYRKPRLHASLPVEFAAGEDVLLGRTQDVSEGGFSANFTEPLLPRTSGRVRLRVGHCLLELAAEVTHAEGFTSGISFLFASPRERAFVQAVVQALHAALQATNEHSNASPF